MVSRRPVFSRLAVGLVGEGCKDARIFESAKIGTVAEIKLRFLETADSRHASAKAMERTETIAALRAAQPIIAPSLLKCDYGHWAQEIATLEAAGASFMHWDVMDGHFVPNLSYGALPIRQMRQASPSIFDAHLMISEPDRYLDDYLAAGADIITIHVEANSDPKDVLTRIRAANRVAGLAINPETKIDRIEPYLSECDLLLLMTVHPGFGGQAFIPEVLPKMTELRRLAPETLISVDGGIDQETIGDAAAAGADIFVAGSAVFEAKNYEQAISDLRGCAVAGKQSSASVQ